MHSRKSLSMSNVISHSISKVNLKCTLRTFSNWPREFKCVVDYPLLTSLCPSLTESIRGVLVLLKFWRFSSELTKTWSSGATECRVWIGNCNVKVWKSTEHKLHNIWRSVKFQQNEHTPAQRPVNPSLCMWCYEKNSVRDRWNGFTLNVLRWRIQ